MNPHLFTYLSTTPFTSLSLQFALHSPSPFHHHSSQNHDRNESELKDLCVIGEELDTTDTEITLLNCR